MQVVTWLCSGMLLLVQGSPLEIDFNKPPPTSGLLFPQDSETREVRSLDGIWHMVKGSSSGLINKDNQENLFEKGLSQSGRHLIPMAVPASYNDITVSRSLRDHVGPVWYERSFFVPSSWDRRLRTWLRFGSVHYRAEVWINGQHVVRHSSGGLPFEAEVGGVVNFGAENRLTVMCDNRLDNLTIPQGELHEDGDDTSKRTRQEYGFDFFNYAGIHRSVLLYSTPLVFISDVSVSTEYTSRKVGIVKYRLWIAGKTTTKWRRNYYFRVQLRDQQDEVVAQQVSRHPFKGRLRVHHARAWWPYLMDHEPGYLYRLKVELFEGDSEIEETSDDDRLDVYRMSVGIRSLKWDNNSLLLNGKSLYLRGFGRHEDSEIRGRGHDNPLMLRDFNLLRWIGANAYRTSHYPYSEESMQFADEQGIMVIDECSAVDLEGFHPGLLQNHMSAMEQLIHRDRNHPSVIAWSLANEPSCTLQSAEYFKSLVNYTRNLDHGRPLTAALATPTDEASKCELAGLVDILGFNRYNGWYSTSGRLDRITGPVETEATMWHNLTNKLVIMMEYGADSIESYRSLPSLMGSPDFQRQLYSQHFQAFDKLRENSWFIGEFVWNFADFQTAQSYTRIGGNRKGIFTRDRQPKEMAYVLRRRYFGLAHKLNQAKMPTDLEEYVVGESNPSKQADHESGEDIDMY
ncbi:beta-glucuronidase-like [Drosophila subpulchrella]|uniref:beta-glucuronidase-like n=1 Tax=Drosophila subpulchrella TaxID=1486046 RepID=UPI0018A19C4E|nr:beta-glucuronidase-like [Drosophila subpulchrella]